MAAVTRFGSRANLPSSGLTQGELLFTLDRGTLYAALSGEQNTPVVPAVGELVALLGSGVVSSQDYIMIHDADEPGIQAKKILVSELLLGLGGVPSSEKGAANGVATLGADSKIPLSQLPDAILGALRYQGTWNASTNTPSIPTASSSNRGYYYVVSVSGSSSVDGESDWQAGDWIVSNGSSWGKVDNSDKVSSVAGKTGAVTLVSGDVGLGNVDNTSDADKPVSTSQQAALDLKANKSQESWTAATLQNGWSNFGSGYQAARFFKDELGVVHLEGLVAGGSLGAAVFTLPAGYRPSAHLILPVANANYYGEVTINSSGQVVSWGGGNSNWLSLSGISFRV